MLAQISVMVNQLTPGTTQIAPAYDGVRYAVIAFMLSISANGTMKFADDSGDLTGPMTLIKDAAPMIFSSAATPLAYTHPGESLKLVTTQGAARGAVVYLKSD